MGVAIKGRTAPWLMSHRLQVSQSFLRLSARVRGREERCRRKASAPKKGSAVIFQTHYSVQTANLGLIFQLSVSNIQ